MNAKVYLVRCRQEDRAGAHLQPGCEPRSWIETHIVMKPTVWDRIADWVFDDRHGWRPFIIILTLVAIWALILESAVGLDVLRHLLGWNLY